jgi:uncharacterized repeat protein (TIGR03803 family)
LYGLTSDGGYYSDGVIFRINKYSHLTEVIYQFQNFTDSFYLSNHQDGSKPRGSMVKGVDGLFYGMCATGGTENKGTIFRFDPSNFNYEVLYNFIDSSALNESGRTPFGSLTWFNDSIAYAVTSHGESMNQTA